ncbi:MAG TPA: sigma 54-interacting transcriptional regulator [Desulfosalsimonadaceae bacterium]|nr:sigma 54-interacting transcriptional regulator [Desulfosalsimonadaceae bacterium]
MTEKKFREILTNEKNLIRILDNLKEGIIAHDLNRRIFFFNHEAERITGYSREEVLYQDCHEAFGGPFCGERCLFREANHTIPDDIEYPVNILRKDGQIRNAEMHVTAMKDDTGEMFGVLAFIKDNTDVVELKLKTGQLIGYGDIVGRDSQMVQIYKQIQDLASYDYPVHIYGETGTGKELVAEAIHNQSRRAGAPFVPINCGALPEGLIESELFGHVKGAFSGAIRDKKGRFELADGGSVFLDEVAELPKDLQVKLLRFLQTGKFEKVGGEDTISVHVRIISATNAELDKAVKARNFREDLYYRLNVIPIHIPPLRERRTDIPILVDYFLKAFSGPADNERIKISDEALSMMMDYEWPGNVRQLQNALQYAIVKCSSRIIRPKDLPMELADRRVARSRRGPVKKLDIDAVRDALEKTAGNKAMAARLLGVGRATLYRFIHEYPSAVPQALENHT